MAAIINILVTCANRKAVPTPPELMLRAVNGRDVAERADHWLERLRSSRSVSVPAIDLYSGDHWHVVRSLAATAAGAGFKARVWVCSAGYGLIPVTAAIRSYAATFSGGHADSVLNGCKINASKHIRRAWWEALARWQGPVASARSLACLAEQHPDAPLLVAASPPYLDAIAADLAAAALALGETRVSIFCAGGWDDEALAKCMIPCDARLQAAVGGGRTSLNARCLRHALLTADGKSASLENSILRKSFATLLGRQRGLDRPARAAQSDDAVRAYIRDALAAEPALSATALLGRLRAAGRACEQARFGRLFRQIGEGGHG